MSSDKPAIQGRVAVDLNCDMGEGIANDALIMPYISSANVACGYHAGNEQTIWETIELAAQHGVAVGAHVSFLDRQNFGRKDWNLSTAEIFDLIIQQLVIIGEIADEFGQRIKHVKPHGALYNRSARDAELAHTIALATKDFDASLILVGLSGSMSISEAEKLGLKAASEVFADRHYRSDGSLVPRSEKNALIENIEESLDQVLQMISKGTVNTLDNKIAPVVADTVCIHGDGPGAVQIATAIYHKLKEENIEIRPF